MSSPLPHPSLDQVIDLMLDAVCVVDRDGRFLYVSAASEQVFGYKPEEMVGRMVWDLVHPEDQELTRTQAEQVMSGNSSTQIENRYIRKDGSVAHIMWSARWSALDQVRVGVARDVTRRKQAEQAQSALLRISQAAHRTGDLPTLLEEVRGIIAGLMSCRNFQVALYDSPTRRWSYPCYLNERHAEPPVPEGRADPYSEQVMRAGTALLLDREALASSTAARGDAGPVPLCWLGTPLVGDEGIIGVLAVQSYSPHTEYTGSDQQLLQFVSDQVASAISYRTMLSRLEYLAQYDPLTELPNRALLNDRLLKAIRTAERKVCKLALLFVDMDDFKQVNDTLGHAAGDRLLQLAAHRLVGCVRASDTVARLGGDEFVVVIEGLSEPGHAEALVEKIRLAFEEPFDIDGEPVTSRLSIGVALYPRDGGTPAALLRHADTGMYAAKKP